MRRNCQHPSPRPRTIASTALAVVVVFASCATIRPFETNSEPQAAKPPEAPSEEAKLSPLLLLYEVLAANQDLYLAGIDNLAAGAEVMGERQIAVATGGLLSGADTCAETEGCAIELWIDTFDRLLSRQSMEIKSQSVRIEELEVGAQRDVEREPGTTAFVAAIPELGETESLLRGTDFKEMITLNEPVKAALDDWLTWMRPLLIDSYENYQWLRSRMAPVYEEAGLPEALLFAMLATETGGKVHSYSRAGAAGPLQFMRGTGRRYGLRTIDGFDMRLDPEAATRANVAYLNDQFEELNNDLELALAAYNGGENRVKSLHRRYRSKSLWDSQVFYSLPRETREYVPRILAAAWLFLHAEDYDLEFPVFDTSTTRIALEQDIALGELAICLGQTENDRGWFRTLRNLNPRLSPGDRVEAGEQIEIPTILLPTYEQSCRGGDSLTLARELHDANYPEEPEMIPYTVRSGDTLGKIASRHRCVSIGELAAINSIRPPRYVIRVGQTLKIPGCG